VDYDALQKHHELSESAFEKKKIQESLRSVISQTMQKANGKEDFKHLMRGKEDWSHFCENKAGWILYA
jgi:hypothetical protein